MTTLSPLPHDHSLFSFPTATRVPRTRLLEPTRRCFDVFQTPDFEGSGEYLEAELEVRHLKEDLKISGICILDFYLFLDFRF